MTSKQSSPSAKRAVGQFSTESEAKQAQRAIESAGFAPEQISLETEKLDPKPPQKESQARKGSFGAAIAGAVLGSGFGLLASIAATSASATGPDVASNSGVFTTLIATVGGLVGALAFSLMGALAGGATPQESMLEDSESLSTKYLLVVRGTEAETVKAKEIMREQGAQV